MPAVEDLDDEVGGPLAEAEQEGGVRADVIPANKILPSTGKDRVAVAIPLHRHSLGPLLGAGLADGGAPLQALVEDGLEGLRE